MIVHRAWIAGLGTALSLGLASSDADPSSERPPESTIYAGSVELDDSRPLGLVGMGWGSRFTDDGGDRMTEGVVALGVRAWPLAHFWVETGGGGALGMDQSVAPAMMSGTGVQLVVGEMPLEVSFHAGSGIEPDGTTCAFHASLGLSGNF